MTGWFKIDRKLFDNEIWLDEPFTRAQAWIDLVGNANHKGGHFFIRGNEVTVGRGQLGWSEVTMAKRWQWGRNKVRGFLKWLENRQQIEQQKDRYITTIITICNYNRYQNDTADDTAERQQKDSRRNINKKDKNVKNEKKHSIATQDVANKEVNIIITLFRNSINPTINYGNTTSRHATDDLIKRMGIDKLTRVVKYAVSVQGQDYAPTITTPYQLKEKLAALLIYYKKNNKQREVIKI